jgi:WD40 repeat protein
VQKLAEPDPAAVPEITAYWLAFSADGRYLAVVYALTLVLYMLDVDGEVKRVATQPLKASQCAFRPDGGVLACLVGGLEPRVTFLRVPGGEVLHVLEKPARAIAWNPDGRLLAGAYSNTVNIFDVVAETVTRRLSVEERTAFLNASFSADSRWMVAMDAQRADIWDVQSGAHGATLVARAEHGYLFHDAAFSPQGARLAMVGGPVVTVWEIQGQ